jgi:hypothetical protein
MTEKGVERGAGPDARIAERLDGVLQLMADRGDELTARRPTRIHDHAQKAVWTGEFDRHVETRTQALSTRALDDVNQAVGRTDGLNQKVEGRRMLRATRDSGCKNRILRANPNRRRLLRAGARAVRDERETDNDQLDDTRRPAVRGTWYWMLPGHGVSLLAHEGGKRDGNLETAKNSVEFAHC